MDVWAPPWNEASEFTSLHLKMDGWNTIRILLGWPIFRSYVSFREGNDEFSDEFSKKKPDMTFHDSS